MDFLVVDFCGDTLPETNIFAPANGWLEYDCFLLGILPIFSGQLLVSGSVIDPNFLVELLNY